MTQVEVMTDEDYAVLDKFQRVVLAWNDKNFPGRSSADRMFKGMVEELGELAHADLKREQGIRGTESELTDLGKDAVGDLMIYTAAHTARKDWSLGECVRRAWDEVKDRDWGKFPGNGRTV